VNGTNARNVLNAGQRIWALRLKNKAICKFFGTGLRSGGCFVLELKWLETKFSF